MKQRFVLFALATATFLAACGADDSKHNPVERLGLLETALGRPLVARAIAAANAIMGTRTTLRLAGSWQPSADSHDQILVRVYLIDSGAAPSVYSVMVPDSCRCIFVQPTAFDAWMKDHAEALPQMLTISADAVLTFMLLHEVGHVVHGDPGQFEEVTGAAAINVDQTAQKDRESAADQFAVAHVAAALDDGKAIDGWLAATSVSLSLSDLSWNLSTLRFLNHFGATTLCSRVVFADSGYTHPNFEFRILAANNMLAQTAESEALMNGFAACRINPAPRLLYEAK
jgi:hypothetical protein